MLLPSELTMRSRWRCVLNNVTDEAISGNVSNTRQTILVPIQFPTRRVVHAIVPRSVHSVDLFADIVHMAVIPIRQPELALRVVAPTTVRIWPYNQHTTHTPCIHTENFPVMLGMHKTNYHCHGYHVNLFVRNGNFNFQHKSAR